MSAHVELRHLRAFVALAQELHFTRAAERLHLAQQAVSAQIRQLEDELGTALFVRTTRHVELTDAGRTLLSHAEPLLGALTTALEQTVRASAGELGRLAICYTPTVTDEALPILVDELHRRYPSVRLRTCEMWQAESVDAVNTGRFDIGMARCPVDLGEELECISIRDEPMGLILGARHRLAAEPSISMEQVANETLVIWPRELSPGFFDHVVGAFHRHGFAGQIREFENLGPEVLMSDHSARADVAAARAFSVAFATMYDPVPPEFVWRDLDPVTRVPVHMFWRRSAGSVVTNFVRLARQVAEREQWLVPVAAAAS
jgi:DNA-binding transcriptional LysR family regulator